MNARITPVFREFRTDVEYSPALRAEIDENLALFEADDTPGVIRNYPGSRVHVREP